MRPQLSLQNGFIVPKIRIFRQILDPDSKIIHFNCLVLKGLDEFILSAIEYKDVNQEYEYH